jgi:hypothetical protein
MLRSLPEGELLANQISSMRDRSCQRGASLSKLSIKARLTWIMDGFPSCSPLVVDKLPRRLVPDELWVLAEPLIPQAKAALSVVAYLEVDDRAVFTAIVLVPDQRLCIAASPTHCRVTVPTAHRQFMEYTQAGLWRQLHRRC